MLYKKIIESSDSLIERANNIAREQKEFVNWGKNLKFLNNKDKTINNNVMSLVQNFIETDHLARIAWDSDFVIVFANKNFLDVLGYNMEDVVGKKIMDEHGHSPFISENTILKSVKAVQDNMEDPTRDKMLFSLENEWIAKDGRTLPIRWLAGFNDTKNKIGSTQCIFLTEKNEEND